MPKIGRRQQGMGEMKVKQDVFAAGLRYFPIFARG
jgi:hypothetical protein